MTTLLRFVLTILFKVLINRGGNSPGDTLMISEGYSFFSVKWKMRSAECGVRSMENAECGKCGVWKMWSVENEECGKCGVWKTRSVENKSLQNGKLNNDILNNDKFIDQTYTLIRHIQRIGLNDDGFLLGYDIETKFSRIFTNHIHSTSYF